MSVDDQLRRAAGRVNAELEVVPVPDPPQRQRRVWVPLALGGLATAGVVVLALWISGGENTSPAVSGDATTTTVPTLEQEDAAEDVEHVEPQPVGVEETIAVGVVDGSDETWRLSAFISTEGELCIRLMLRFHCGPVPNAATPLSSPSTSIRDVPTPRLSCSSGGLIQDAVRVTLRFSDGSSYRAPVYSGGGLPASFYAHCWLGDRNLTSVQVTDIDGEILAVGGPDDPVPTDKPGTTALFTLSYSRADGFYIEGSATEWDLAGARDRLAAGAILMPGENSTLVQMALEPGTYTIRNWQRPCPGSCAGELEPPVDVCAARFTVEGASTITATVTVRPGQGCGFDFEGVEATSVDPGDPSSLQLSYPVLGSN